MKSVVLGTIGAALGTAWALAPASAAGNAESGARAFKACAACHSLEAGRHMTGPSLAGIVERKAGTVQGFTRYSRALKSAEIIWNEQTLDAWLADPKAFVPGNSMTFPGLKDQGARADLIAFLNAANGGGAMDSPELQNLKTLSPEQRVTAIRYCGDAYHVTTAEGEMPPFWEANLRFKTDSGDKGPAKGRPAILPSGMMGDRASIFFSEPAEISEFIVKKC